MAGELTLEMLPLIEYAVRESMAGRAPIEKTLGIDRPGRVRACAAALALSAQLFCAGTGWSPYKGAERFAKEICTFTSDRGKLRRLREGANLALEPWERELWRAHSYGVLVKASIRQLHPVLQSFGQKKRALSETSAVG